MLEREDGYIVSDDTEVVKIFIRQWSSIYIESPNKVNSKYFDSQIWDPKLFANIPDNINWQALFLPIILKELKNIIKSLKTNSFLGLSFISYD